MKVVKDPSGLLWDLFSPPVFNIEKADSKSNIKNPTFVGGIAKWSLEKYLTDQGKSDSSVPKIPDEYSESSKTKKRGSGSDDSSDEQGTTNSGSSHTSVEDLAERLDSLKLDAPPPAGTTIDLRQKASIKIEYKGAPHIHTTIFHLTSMLQFGTHMTSPTQVLVSIISSSGATLSGL